MRSSIIHTGAPIAPLMDGRLSDHADEDEGVTTAEELWQARRDTGDRAPLRLDEVLAEHEEAALDPLDLIRRLVDLAMATDRVPKNLPAA